MAEPSLNDFMGGMPPPTAITPTGPGDTTPKQDYYSVNVGGKTILLPNADNSGKQLGAADAVSAYKAGTLTAIKEFNSQEEAGEFLAKRQSSSSSSSSPAASSSSRKTSSPTAASDASAPKTGTTLDDFMGGPRKPTASSGGVGKAVVDVGKGLGLGLGRSYEELATSVATIGGAFPVLYDKAKSLWTGKTTTLAADSYFKGMVDPLIETHDAYNVGSDAPLAERIGSSVGDVMGFISQMVVTGGAGAETGVAKGALGRAGAALKTSAEAMQVPAISTAVNTGRQVYLETGDAKKARQAAEVQYALLVAQGSIPIAAKGSALVRGVTGAASATATGEGSRRVMNQFLPKDMQQDFTIEGVAQNALFGVGLGQVVGKPTEIPKVFGTVLNGREAQGHYAKFKELLATDREAAHTYATEVVAPRDPELATLLQKEATTKLGKFPGEEETNSLIVKEHTAAAQAAANHVAMSTAAGAKVDSAFDELVVRDKETAEKVAAVVEESNPELGKELKSRTKGRVTQAKIDEAAEAAVKANEFMEDTIAGKDKIIPPDRAEIVPTFTDKFFKTRTAEDDKAGNVYRFKNPVMWKDGGRLSGFSDRNQTTFFGYDKNGEMFTIRREYVKLEDIGTSKDSNVTSEQVKKGLSRTIPPDRTEAYYDKGLHPEWRHATIVFDTALDDLHIYPKESIPDEVNVKETGGKPGQTTAHKLLDNMLRYDHHPSIKGILEKIRQNVDDIQVHIGDKVIDNDGSEAGGLYDPHHHSILISPRMGAKAVAHELVHAYTSRWFLENKGHALYKDTEFLLEEARRRAKLANIEQAKMYGLTNVKEFVSEAMSNANFQKFLIESEKHAAPDSFKDRGLLNRLSEIIQKLFGVTDPNEAKLFNEIIRNVNEIGMRQKGMGGSRYHTDQLESVYKVGWQRGKTKAPSPMGDVDESLSKRRMVKAVTGERKSIRGTKGDLTAAIEALQKSIDEDNKKYGPLRPEDLPLPKGQGRYVDPPILPPDRISAGMRDSMKEVSEPESSSIDSAFSAAAGLANKSNAVRLGTSKLRQYIEQAQRTFSPESLGPEAKIAGASIAKAMSEEAQKTSAYTHGAKVRKAFWDKNAALARDFINRFEKGEIFADPTLNKAASGYRQWNAKILDQDTATGFNYEPVDHYLMHVFKDSKAVEDYFNAKYGKKWGDPAFIKARTFSLYEEAMKAGFEPKYTNPEDIMLARQHASDVAQMREQVLKDMVQYGLGVKVVKTKGADGKTKTTPRPSDYTSTYWRSPTGDGYWIHNTANAVMDNAFNSKSLWNEQGIAGDAFRGTMLLKNAVVPVKLALSLFHPLHVIGIDNAATMMRSSKGMLSGKVSPARWLADMTKSGLLYESLPFVGKNTRLGSRMLEAWQGKIKGEYLSAADKQALMYMGEGGFIPEMAAQYRTGAVDKFMSAVRQHKASALWHAPFAAIDALQRPIFERWIPGLKIASYLHDVDMALKTDPSLLDDSLKRQLAFRKLAKSVDNRYGEMAYNTLFWNKWVKDITVGSTLSLGWNLGFIREYGGGALDVWEAGTTKGGLGAKASKGLLDKPMFVMAYTTTALAYGGLMTYALSGQAPQGLIDYVYPQTGDKEPDGKPARVNTMFYTREFGSIYSHIKNEGVIAGGLDVIKSKASPLFDMMHSWATNTNFYNQEISNPNDPLYKRLEQKVAYTLSDMEPISVQSSVGGGKSSKDIALNVAGFTKAPKYATESSLEGNVIATFRKYFPQPVTPYEKAEQSADAKKLKQMYNADDPGYDAALDKMVEKYSLTDKEIKKLTTSFDKNENTTAKLFQRLDWREQKRILDAHWNEMSEDEREVYLAHSSSEHLRDNYEPPEESK